VAQRGCWQRTFGLPDLFREVKEVVRRLLKV